MELAKYENFVLVKFSKITKMKSGGIAWVTLEICRLHILVLWTYQGPEKKFFFLIYWSKWCHRGPTYFRTFHSKSLLAVMLEVWNQYCLFVMPYSLPYMNLIPLGCSCKYILIYVRRGLTFDNQTQCNGFPTYDRYQPYTWNCAKFVVSSFLSRN